MVTFVPLGPSPGPPGALAGTLPGMWWPGLAW